MVSARARVVKTPVRQAYQPNEIESREAQAAFRRVAFRSSEGRQRAGRLTSVQ